MRRQCRIWWPKHLSSTEPSSFYSILFGWFVSCASGFLDIVVAFACDEVSLCSCQASLKDILCDTNGSMSVILQDKSMFSLLGQCAAYPSNNRQLFSVGVGENSPRKFSTDGIARAMNNKDMPRKKNILCCCGCHKLKGVLEKHRKAAIGSNHWIQMDEVILAMNSASASKMVFERHVGSKRSFAKLSIICRFIALVWQLLAVSMASLSTMFYTFLQLLHCLLSYGSQTWIYITSARVFNTTWINIQTRCGQILYWPILLQDNDLRSQSCVEYAEKAALHKHSMWSSLVVDVLLGNLIGFSLLFHSESVCSWVLNFANHTTNDLLRSGCVWLMGVPAGFKLNTELAGVLGMISLNVIQIWSTLWFFVDSLFIYVVKGHAILGILLGVTVPAALVRDLIVLVTLHVSTLHWMISLLYSQQIQVLASLWRLFRGRKWNPLRQRLDSYDYTVKQHIIGSLLFTPLLLLLPTTSVFYIFYTMVTSSISLICILIEVTISVIHATPYIKIVLWLLRRRRFPTGIWFEIVSYHSNGINSPEITSLDKISSSSKNSQHQENISGRRNVLVSILHSNFLTIGQIVMPHFRKDFTSVSRSFFVGSAYGVLTGKRIASSLGTKLPSTMPWMFIPHKEYWCLCRNSILECMPKRDCHVCQ